MIKNLISGFEERFGFKPKLPKNIVFDNGKAFELNQGLMNAKFRTETMSRGILLATIGRRVLPSQYLLDMNKHKFKNVILLEEKISFLFTCGRHILRKSILEKRGKGPIFLVINIYDEVLGLIELKNKEYKNIICIGDCFNEDKLRSVRF